MSGKGGNFELLCPRTQRAFGKSNQGNVEGSIELNQNTLEYAGLQKGVS